jgi:hypothetical protein
MVISEAKLFEQGVEEFVRHVAHKLSLIIAGGAAAPESLAIECEDCHEILIEFVPEASGGEPPDPDHVRYEGHYDPTLDLCYVEVFKPGKAAYPLQERQDLINHSPTGIAWGYGGSGPAQCAFALLMDCLGDEQRARTLYQDFKFRTIAALSPNQPWTLTGRQIEQEVARIEARRKSSTAEHS